MRVKINLPSLGLFDFKELSDLRKKHHMLQLVLLQSEGAKSCVKINPRNENNHSHGKLQSQGSLLMKSREKYKSTLLK